MRGGVSMEEICMSTPGDRMMAKSDQRQSGHSQKNRTTVLLMQTNTIYKV